MQLTEHVWLWPHDSDASAVQSSVGVIAAGKESVLVDAGNSPKLARRVKTELARCGFPPVSRVIYTHHHWDHVYGACEFKVPVMAHAKCKVILEEEARKPWSCEYLREETRRNPALKVSYEGRARAIRDWDTFRIVVPEAVFEETETIHLGEVTIELEHIGGEHAEDSIVVKVPQEGVMFLGDCYYPPPLHLRVAEPTVSIDMLRRLESAGYDLYVESHDEPFTRGELLEFLAESVEEAGA